jgi:3-oxoacyl-[acyl-carrier protein] reductase
LRLAGEHLSDGGRIVNLSSSVTRLLFPGYGAYAATKAAVDQFTRIFAREVGPRNITVNAVAPGPTRTELFTLGKTEETIGQLASMSAMGRIGEPEDVARVVAFLCSDEAAWITGQIIGVNGGFA